MLLLFSVLFVYSMQLWLKLLVFSLEQKLLRLSVRFLLGWIWKLIMLFLCLWVWVNRVELILFGQYMVWLLSVVGLQLFMIFWLLCCRLCFLQKFCIMMFMVLVLFLQLNRLLNCGLVLLGRFEQMLFIEVLVVNGLVNFSGLCVMMLIELVVLFLMIFVLEVLCIIIWLIILDGSRLQLMLWFIVCIWFSMNQLLVLMLWLLISVWVRLGLVLCRLM